MKKLLFALTLSALFVCCNNQRGVPGSSGYTVPYPPDSTHTMPWTNTLIDSSLAKGYAHSFDSFFAAKNEDASTLAFAIHADALLHAITDSPNITHVIFYLGKKDTTETLSLMYLPARAVYLGDSIIRYDEILVGRQVFDQSVPCPTCDMKGPMPATKTHK